MNFIDSMLKFLGQKSLVAVKSGDTESGRYIHLSDGTAIVYGQVTGSGAIDVAYGNCWYHVNRIPIDWSAAELVDVPEYLNIQIGADQVSVIANQRLGNLTKDGTDFRISCSREQTDEVDYIAYYCVIGKWE